MAKAQSIDWMTDEHWRASSAGDPRVHIRPFTRAGEREELPHCRRSSGGPGRGLDAHAFEHQAQNALVLIERAGLISGLRGRWADKNCHHPTSAVCVVAA